MKVATAHFLSLLGAALTWFLLFSITGIVCLVVGVYIVAGMGYAFLAAGMSLLLSAYFVGKGMKRV